MCKNQSLLKTQELLFTQTEIKQCHILSLPSCCPISGNPKEGSIIKISYTSKDKAIEVYSLRQYIDSFIGGYDDVRGMEDMIKKIALDCHSVLGISILVKANLILEPNQKMILRVSV